MILLFKKYTILVNWTTRAEPSYILRHKIHECDTIESTRLMFVLDSNISVKQNFIVHWVKWGGILNLIERVFGSLDFLVLILILIGLEWIEPPQFIFDSLIHVVLTKSGCKQRYLLMTFIFWKCQIQVFWIKTATVISIATPIVTIEHLLTSFDFYRSIKPMYPPDALHTSFASLQLSRKYHLHFKITMHLRLWLSSRAVNNMLENQSVEIKASNLP